MRRFCAVLALAALFVLPGCSDDKGSGPPEIPPGYVSQNTITGVLAHLKTAYNGKNAAEFTALLDDPFTFVFAPYDVAGEHGVPPSWNKAAEVQSATRMLGGQANQDGYRCVSISLNFTSGADDTTGLDPTWRKVRLTQVQLYVDCRHEADGNQLIYEILGDRADLYLRQTEEIDPFVGGRVWKIVRWEDKPIGGKASTENTTWGRIKAVWHEPADWMPPAAPANPAVAALSDSVAVLTWTAPGDDGTSGRATAYDVRYSTSATVLAGWVDATQAADEPTPALPGTRERFQIPGLSLAQPCYFAVKAVDDAVNWSPMSGQVSTNGYYAPVTVSNVIRNLKLSYNQKNVDEYEALLDDAYTFVFDPRDVGGEHNIPESWGTADEILSATHLLTGQPNADGYLCESISLAFTAGAEGPSDIQVDWRKVTLSQVALYVNARHTDYGERLMYEVLNDRADLHFMQTAEVESVTGERIWKIVHWVDRPILIGAKASTQPTTWGRVKAIWR